MIHLRTVALPALIIVASTLGGCGKKDEAGTANAKSPEPPKPAAAAAAPAAPKGLPVKAERVKIADVQSDVTAAST